MNNFAFVIFYYLLGSAFGYHWAKVCAQNRKEAVLGFLSMMNLWVLPLLIRLYLFTKEDKWAFYGPEGKEVKNHD